MSRKPISSQTPILLARNICPIVIVGYMTAQAGAGGVIILSIMCNVGHRPIVLAFNCAPLIGLMTELCVV